MINNGIPKPEKQATPIIPLEDDYYLGKNPIDSSSILLKKRTINMNKICSLPELQ